MQEHFGGPHRWIAVKAILHYALVQQIVQRNQTHALMMGHVGVHYCAVLAFLDSFRSEIERFIESIGRKRAGTLECSQILNCIVRENVRSENRRIRRYHEVFDQTALQSQTGNAERPVLIVEMQIARRVSRFRNSPGHAALAAIFDLSRHHRFVGFAQQRLAIVAHDQQRHEVFEHRAGP